MGHAAAVFRSEGVDASHKLKPSDLLWRPKLFAEDAEAKSYKLPKERFEEAAMRRLLVARARSRSIPTANHPATKQKLAVTFAEGKTDDWSKPRVADNSPDNSRTTGG